MNVDRILDAMFDHVAKKMEDKPEKPEIGDYWGKDKSYVVGMVEEEDLKITVGDAFKPERDKKGYDEIFISFRQHQVVNQLRNIKQGIDKNEGVAYIVYCNKRKT